MKLNITLIGLLALVAPALAAPTPVVVEERAANPQYADYGTYPPLPGGYGSYVAYPTTTPTPTPTPTPVSYGKYPCRTYEACELTHAGTYANYGTYKRFVKSLFA